MALCQLESGPVPIMRGWGKLRNKPAYVVVDGVKSGWLRTRTRSLKASSMVQPECIPWNFTSFYIVKCCQHDTKAAWNCDFSGSRCWLMIGMSWRELIIILSKWPFARRIPDAAKLSSTLHLRGPREAQNLRRLAFS